MEPLCNELLPANRIIMFIDDLNKKKCLDNNEFVSD